MIHLPLFEHVEVAGYGLYPGTVDAPGLTVEFQPGLTLVLGTNGLGKSTLVLLLYRLLTGPYDIPGLDTADELGRRRLFSRRVSADRRTAFASRVSDGASEATAQLRFTLGGHEVRVTRRLDDLSLLAFSVDGESQDTSDETTGYQKAITEMALVPSFGDWILVLRHLTFYFEDRRALIWDPSAQRQILRLLFLSEEEALAWADDERRILALDSKMRNARSELTSDEKALADGEAKLRGGEGVREELSALQGLQEIDEARLTELERDVLALDSQRRLARRRVLTSEQALESRHREVEQERLTSIASAFPSRSDTARYIIAQLMAEQSCLVCGTVRPDAVAEYEARADAHRCVVCDTDLSGSGSLDVVAPAFLSPTTNLEALQNDVRDARRTLETAEESFGALSMELADLGVAAAQRAQEILFLKGQLPPGSDDLERERSELKIRRRRVEDMQRELTNLRSAFSDTLESKNVEIRIASEGVQAVFDATAEDFLFESCHLAWSPQKERVGQGGETVEFPAYEVDLSGSDFVSTSRRTGPDQVSESQREFIDISFRIALMAVASEGGGGSLVVDAPESSLDGVFSRRAAGVLASFANAEAGNRLVLTSNMIDGDLIPELVRAAGIAGETESRVVDLLSIAAPTAAVEQMRDEYRALQQKLLTPR